MELAIDMIINTLIYCLYLLLFIGTLILGFVQPMALLSWVPFMTGVIITFVAIWLLVTGWDYIIQGIVFVMSIITNGLLTTLGMAWAFIAGIGEGALAALQAGGAIILASLQGGLEGILAFVGLGHWLTSEIIAIGLQMIAVAIGTIGTVGYGFGMAVVILLNLVATAAAGLAGLAGLAPEIGTIIGGLIALLALPWLVRLLIFLAIRTIHLISLISLRLTSPIWRSSWILGWIIKMFLACVTLAFYIERSIKNRPTITLSWDGQQWAVAA